MSNTGESSRNPIEYFGEPFRQYLAGDPQVPLLNLSALRMRIDSVQRFLSDSLNENILIGKDQMDMVSSEISSAINQIIVNGAALLACSQSLISGESTFFPTGKLSNSPSVVAPPNYLGPVKDKVIEELKFDARDEDVKNETDDCDRDCEIVELDAVELLAEHIHFCEICGKGFKRDANLRMHMRAHGNKFKTLEALAKPLDKCPEPRARRTRFSCPYQGCNRNKAHKKFRPLKSVICVKNHFKRSHCPKMYSCNRCNKKSFSVLADLRSHLKQCGESKWRCSCGTSFSRKDKLFGHMALFEGHMPAVVDEDEKGKGTTVELEIEEDEDETRILRDGGFSAPFNCQDDGFFDGLLDGFRSFDDCSLQDVLGIQSDVNAEMGVL